jgi:alkylhydroperoxidase family enzyme
LAELQRPSAATRFSTASRLHFDAPPQPLAAVEAAILLQLAQRPAELGRPLAVRAEQEPLEPRLLQAVEVGDLRGPLAAVCLSDAERAALRLAEHVTRIDDRSDPVPDEVWDAAAEHYDEEALAAGGILARFARPGGQVGRGGCPGPRC